MAQCDDIENGYSTRPDNSAPSPDDAPRALPVTDPDEDGRLFSSALRSARTGGRGSEAQRPRRMHKGCTSWPHNRLHNLVRGREPQERGSDGVLLEKQKKNIIISRGARER